MLTPDVHPTRHTAFCRLATRRLRLASGLVLFVYITAHLVNHALGLVSLDVAEKGLRAATIVWHSAAGTALLYGAVATHVALALKAVYERRMLRMPANEALRIALGFAMPLQLIAHFIVTRLAHEVYGLRADYHHVVWTLMNGDGHARQLALLAPGWMHGCFGLNRAFGRRAVFGRLRPVLFVAALLLPVLAALGFLAMGHELAALSSHGVLPDTQASMVDAARRIALARIRDVLLATYAGVIGLVLVARALRTQPKASRQIQFQSALFPPE